MVITSLLSKAEDGGIEWMQFKSMDEAIEYSKKVGKPLFVYFTAVWCGPCKKAQQEYFNNPKENEVNREEFVNMKIDIDRDSVLYREAVEEFGYNEKIKVGVPTFQLFFPVDNYKHKFTGYGNVTDFKEAMKFPAVMIKYIKSKDDKILTDALRSNTSMIKNYLRLCLDASDDEKSKDFIRLFNDITNGDNGKEIIQMNELLTFFIKKSHLISKEYGLGIYSFFKNNISYLDEWKYHTFLSLFYSEKSLLSELIKIYKNASTDELKKRYRYSICSWIKRNILEFEYFDEKEMYRILLEHVDSVQIDVFMIDSKCYYYMDRNDEDLFNKYYIEFFNKYNISPLVSDSVSVAYNLNFFAWYRVYRNEDANIDLLKKGLHMSLRSIESYYKSGSYNSQIFESYLDTYFNIIKRMSEDSRIDDKYVEIVYKINEQYLFSFLKDDGKEAYYKEKNLLSNKIEK